MTKPRSSRHHLIGTFALCLLSSACGAEAGQDGSDFGDSAESEPGSSSQPLETSVGNAAWVYFDGTRIRSDLSFNNQGRTNTITRLGEGKYELILRGTKKGSAFRENLQVSVVEQLGLSAAFCTAYGTTAFSTPDWWDNLEVTVACYDSGGRAQDAAFFLSATALSEEANVDETRYGTYAKKSNLHDGTCRLGVMQPGTTGTCSKLGGGRYKLYFAGPTKIGGTVQLTADSSSPNYCNVQNWFPEAAGTSIYVNCFGPNGQPEESNFYIRYQLRTHENQGGFVWAHSPTSSSYVPLAAYNDRKAPCFSTPEHDIAVRRSTPSNGGEYLVTYPWLADVPGPRLVHTTAYGNTSNFCRIGSPPFEPGDAPEALRVKVNCYNTSGGFSETKFTQLLEINDEPVCVF